MNLSDCLFVCLILIIATVQKHITLKRFLSYFFLHLLVSVGEITFLKILQSLAEL